MLADKLDPLVKAHSSREKAAQAMGIKAHVIQYICSRRAMLSIPKEDFVRLTEMLGVDVSKWDLARY